MKRLRAIVFGYLSAFSAFWRGRPELRKISSSLVIKRQLIESIIGLFVLPMLFYYFIVVDGHSGLIILASVTIFSWLMFYAIGSVIICLMTILKKQEILAGLQIEEYALSINSRIGDRLVFSGGEGWISLYTTIYSPKAKRNAIIFFIFCFAAMLIWLFVKP